MENSTPVSAQNLLGAYISLKNAALGGMGGSQLSVLRGCGQYQTKRIGKASSKNLLGLVRELRESLVARVARDVEVGLARVSHAAHRAAVRAQHLQRDGAKGQTGCTSVREHPCRLYFCPMQWSPFELLFCFVAILVPIDSQPDKTDAGCYLDQRERSKHRNRHPPPSSDNIQRGDLDGMKCRGVERSGYG